MVQAMDLSPTPTNTIKTPDTDTETPPEAQPTKSLSFTNGSLNRHHPQPPPPPPPPPSSMVVSYRECLKNHAASIGGHALDGCGEFMPCPTAIPTDPTSLKCAACGCHRNFHRREPDEPISGKILSFHPHYPSPPLLPPIRPPHRSSSPSLSPSRSSSPGPTPSPHSPPPVSHLPPNSYFASPPQMLLALSTGFSGPSDEHHHHHHNQSSFNHTAVMKTTESSNGRKRFRTKFSHEQKQKMHLFAEKVGWKMVKSDEEIVEEFCNEIGVGKGVLKVWMHNNKHTLRKRDREKLEGNVDGGDRVNSDSNAQNNNENNDGFHQHEDRKADFNLFSNGSSSPSS